MVSSKVRISTPVSLSSNVAIKQMGFLSMPK
jgi:hypothetical protein